MDEGRQEDGELDQGRPVIGDDESEILRAPVDRLAEIEGDQRKRHPADDIGDRFAGEEPEPAAVHFLGRKIDGNEQRGEGCSQHGHAERPPVASEALVEMVHAGGIEPRPARRATRRPAGKGRPAG